MHKARKVALVLCFLGICLAVVNVNVARAQSVLEGKITGTITDDKGEPLPGATVEATSPAMIGARSALTSAKGMYVFLSLPIGSYKITASLTGFKTVVQENIEVTGGSAVTINMVLPLGTIEETVLVTGAAPVVDVKTSTIDSKIDQAMLDKLPTSRDSFYDLSLSTPGMFDVGKNVMGSPTAYGGDTNQNIFLVNGLDTTNPSGAGFGSMINVNYDNVQEVRMIALGSKAEYGNFSGVAIDVVTKSGTDTFHGSLAGYGQLGTPSGQEPDPNDLGRDWLYLEEGDDYAAYPKSNIEFDLTLGGPFFSKNVWFFAALNYLNDQNKELNWEPITKYHGRYADFKLTATPFKNHHAWISYHYENNNGGGITDGSLDWDPSTAYDYYTQSHAISSQWQWFPSSATFLSVKFLGFWVNDRNQLPDGAPTNPGYVNWWKGVPFDSMVGGAFEGANKSDTTRMTIQADMSTFAENFLGEHDIKFGVQYTRGRLNSQGGGGFFGKELVDPETGEDLGFFGVYPSAYPYRWTYNIQYLQSWYYDYDGLKFYVNNSYSEPHRTIRTSDNMGFFFDDQWSPTRRLTLNLGLRYDKMTAKFGEGGEMLMQPLTPAAWKEDLVATRSRAGSDNLFDFNNWSPRVGLSYDITGDGKTVFRASFGRYYTPIGVESFGSGGPDLNREYLLQQFYSIPWDGLDLNDDGYITGSEFANAARQIPNLTPINAETESGDFRNIWRSSDPSWGLSIDPGLKNQHTDQWTLNLEREIFKDFSLGVTYINRVTKDVIVQWPLNQATQEPWEYEVKTQVINDQEVSLYSIVLKDYDGSGEINGDDITWIDDHQDFQWRNMPDFPNYAGGPTVKANRAFDGFQVTFKKRYSSRWQLMGSLLWNSSDGFAGRNKRQDQDYNMEGTNIWSDQWLGGLNQTVNNMTGPMPFTPRFEFKINGNYTIPKIEMDVGIRYRLHTGRPAWVLADVQQLASWNYDDATPEQRAHWVILTTGGYSQQLVAQAGDDPLYMPVMSILDLRLDKSFNLGGDKKLRFMLDAFNLLGSKAVTNAMSKTIGQGGIEVRSVGRVVGLVPPRTFRLGVLFQF
jgi:outer membrane receptor protein involved in Fe transport